MFQKNVELIFDWLRRELEFQSFSKLELSTSLKKYVSRYLIHSNSLQFENMTSKFL